MRRSKRPKRSKERGEPRRHVRKSSGPRAAQTRKGRRTVQQQRRSRDRVANQRSANGGHYSRETSKRPADIRDLPDTSDSLQMPGLGLAPEIQIGPTHESPASDAQEEVETAGPAEPVAPLSRQDDRLLYHGSPGAILDAAGRADQRLTASVLPDLLNLLRSINESARLASSGAHEADQRDQARGEASPGKARLSPSASTALDHGPADVPGDGGKAKEPGEGNEAKNTQSQQEDEQ